MSGVPEPTTRLRLVTMLGDDPALADKSRSPVIGFSFALFSWLAGCDSGVLAQRGRDFRQALERGEPPPPKAVDLEDWWDIARWVLEHRLAARLEAEGVPQHEARRRAALGVAQMLAPIRELLR
jgi:hypothetical protein